MPQPNQQSGTAAPAHAAASKTSAGPFSHVSSDHPKGNGAILISPPVYFHQKRSVKQNQHRQCVCAQQQSVWRTEMKLPVFFRWAWVEASGTPAGEWVQRAVDALKPETEEQKRWRTGRARRLVCFCRPTTDPPDAAGKGAGPRGRRCGTFVCSPAVACLARVVTTPNSREGTRARAE